MKKIKEWENGPIILAPDVYKDDRGYFFESFNNDEFKKLTGLDITFVQDNESKSAYGVLRGLHFQKPPYAQSKLVRVVKGAALDIVVDIRVGSPTYGQYFTCYLSEENHRQFFVPQGFAHSFLSLKDDTIFQYKCDNYYNKESEMGLAWDTPLPLDDFMIPWYEIISREDIKVSKKDNDAPFFYEIESPFVWEEKEDIDEQ